MACACMVINNSTIENAKISTSFKLLQAHNVIMHNLPLNKTCMACINVGTHSSESISEMIWFSKLREDATTLCISLIMTARVLCLIKTYLKGSINIRVCFVNVGIGMVTKIMLKLLSHMNQNVTQLTTSRKIYYSQCTMSPSCNMLPKKILHNGVLRKTLRSLIPLTIVYE